MLLPRRSWSCSVLEIWDWKLLAIKTFSGEVLDLNDYAKFFVENPGKLDCMSNQKGVISSLGKLNPPRAVQLSKLRSVSEDSDTHLSIKRMEIKT